MEGSGLYKLGALVLIAIVVIAALTYVTGSGRSAVGAVPAALGEPRAGAAALARKEGSDRAAPAAPAAPAEVTCAPDGASGPLGAEIHESSGVAVSRAHAGIFWTHNDSGAPLLYAVDAEGRTVGRVRVTGASVTDWEDIDLGPCPGGGDCLYVADIGDNAARRPFVTVYRLPEPAPGATASAPATAIRLRYPDRAQDAEAMFVLNGTIHIVTKGENGPIAVYRAPANAAAEATLERIRELAPGKVARPERITGADATADGRWIVLRTLHEAAFYPAAELTGSGPAEPSRVDLRALNERQGEGIGFAPDGSLVLTSEGGKKDQPATFARLSCTLP
jgi:hypothetical protein